MAKSLKYAPPEIFFTVSADKIPVLDRSRIEELASAERNEFLKYLDENPVLVQKYSGKCLVVNGCHRVYSSHHCQKVMRVPYYTVHEFEEKSLEGHAFVRVIDMVPVSREEYKEIMNEEPEKL